MPAHALLRASAPALLLWLAACADAAPLAWRQQRDGQHDDPSPLLLGTIEGSLLGEQQRRPDCPGGDFESCAAACDGAPCVRRCTLLCAPPVCVRATTQPLPLSEEQMTSRGPPSGALVVAGGSVVAGSAIYDRFAELAVVGGEDYIVYVPTASGSPCERTPEPAARPRSLPCCWRHPR